MKRIFHPDEKVTLEGNGHRVAAEVVLVAGNDTALAFQLDEPIPTEAFNGVAITRNIAVMQDDEGRLTDLWGNEWRIL